MCDEREGYVGYHKRSLPTSSWSFEIWLQRCINASAYNSIIHKDSTGIPERPDNLDQEYENVHPLLAWYNDNFHSDHMPYNHFQEILKPENSNVLLNSLQER